MSAALPEGWEPHRDKVAVIYVEEDADGWVVSSALAVLDTQISIYDEDIAAIRIVAVGPFHEMWPLNEKLSRCGGDVVAAGILKSTDQRKSTNQ